ncbi:MAG: sigma 54-interacting transcriptional regulator [Myxococcota bacterium]
MAEQETVRHERTGLPVRSLRAEVIEGPDAGRRLVATGDAITIGTAPGNALTLTDNTVSRYHAEIRSHEGRIEVEDHRSTNGTHLGGVGIYRATIPTGSVLTIGKSKVRVDDGETIEIELHGEDRIGEVLGRTPEMRRIMATIQRTAESDAAVLLHGEVGTGKSIIARAIHDSGPRAEKPFEVVDCSSLMPTLVASELFGHEKGAFPGAEDAHTGALERASGGTVLLQEIGELPPPLQASLHSALERKTFRRVGGTKTMPLDVRVLGTSKRDLREEVNQGKFRAELYFRLAVLTIRVPALRERASDIPLLIEAFLKEAGRSDVDKIVPPEVMESLKSYRWPGNVQELKNFVEAAIAMGAPPPLDADGRGIGQGLTVELTLHNLTRETYHDTRDKVLFEFEKIYFPRLLDRTRGNVAQAAREANMDRSYLIQLLKKHRMK